MMVICKKNGKLSPTVSVAEIMEYENGEMDNETTISFFQKLIDSGVAWQLQGSYGRTAMGLVDAGLCYLPGRGL